MQLRNQINSHTKHQTDLLINFACVLQPSVQHINDTAILSLLIPLTCARPSGHDAAHDRHFVVRGSDIFRYRKDKYEVFTQCRTFTFRFARVAHKLVPAV